MMQLHFLPSYTHNFILQQQPHWQHSPQRQRHDHHPNHSQVHHRKPPGSPPPFSSSNPTKQHHPIQKPQQATSAL